jgi:hypothetical protein
VNTACLTQIPFGLGGFLGQNVAGEGLVAPDFSGAGLAETLGRTTVGLDFRHLLLLLRADYALPEGPALFLDRADHHRHEATHLVRPRFDLTQVFQGFNSLLQLHHPPFGVRILTAAEHNGQLDLVSFFEEASRMLDFELKIMLVGFGSHLDFLEFDPNLLLLRLRRSLGLLILEFAEVHDPANRGFRSRRDLDQIKPLLCGSSEGVGNAQDTKLSTFIVDDPDFTRPDIFVDVRLLLSYGSASFFLGLSAARHVKRCRGQVKKHRKRPGWANP